jgi:hypothetical protein
VAALGKLAARLIGVLDPDGAARLEREEAQREINEEFTLIHRYDGGRGFRGQLTDEDGAFIDAALDVLAAPRPAQDGTPDPRPAGKRRADALMDLVRIALQAPDMPESGGEPVTVTVTTNPEHLRADNQSGTRTQTGPATANSADNGAGSGAGCGPAGGQAADRAPAATLDDGTPLSPETTRRLGCDAWLVAAIIDAHGAVLDIGRRSRIVPAPMRRAVILRDGGCAFPGCGRPARWCLVHRRTHRPGQPRAAVRPPPQRRAPPRLAGPPRPQPTTRVHPTTLDRPRPDPTNRLATTRTPPALTRAVGAPGVVCARNDT